MPVPDISHAFSYLPQKNRTMRFGRLIFYQFISISRLKHLMFSLLLLIFFIFLTGYKLLNKRVEHFEILLMSNIFAVFLIFLNIDVMWSFFNKRYEFRFLNSFPFKREQIFIARWISTLIFFTLFLIIFLIISALFSKKLFIEPFIFSLLILIIYLNIITIFSFSSFLHFPIFALIFFSFVGTMLRASLFSYQGDFKFLFIFIGILLPPLDGLTTGSLSIYELMGIAIYGILFLILSIFISKKYEFL